MLSSPVLKPSSDQSAVEKVWQALERKPGSKLCAVFLDELIPLLNSCSDLLRCLKTTGSLQQQTLTVDAQSFEAAAELRIIVHDLMTRREVLPYEQAILKQLDRLADSPQSLLGKGSDREQVYALIAADLGHFYTRMGGAPLNSVCANLKNAVLLDPVGGKVTVFLGKIINISRTAFNIIEGAKPQAGTDTDYLLNVGSALPNKVEILNCKFSD